MDCGELSLQNFSSDDERDRWLDDARERMGLPKPTETEILESQKAFQLELETAKIISEARERGITYISEPYVEESDEARMERVIREAAARGVIYVDESDRLSSRDEHDESYHEPAVLV